MPKASTDQNFLFWNINRKRLNTALVDLCHDNAVDYLMLAECSLNPAGLEKLRKDLSSRGRQFFLNFVQPVMPRPYSQIVLFSIYGRAFIDKPNLIPLSPHEARSKSRYSRFLPLRIKVPGLLSFNLFVVHLRSKLEAETLDLSSRIENVNHRIKLIELSEKKNHSDRKINTIVVGDFNVNPFEYSMVMAKGFHAMMSKKLTNERGREVDKQLYPFFYNPMWCLLGCDKGDSAPPGSYYLNKGEMVRLHWHLYDQVIVRPSMADRLAQNELKLLVNAGTAPLVADGKPDDVNFSDHLPLFFQLKLFP